MKNIGHFQQRRGTAFTLIELLVVIAVIGILASLVFPITAAITKRKQISLAQTQLKGIEMAIDGYKTKLGFYPPDNTNNVVTNQLYFELMGTTNNGIGQPPNLWVTMDGSSQIGVAVPSISTVFSVAGFANTSTRSKSDDQGSAASTFINNLTPNQIGQLNPGSSPAIDILVCSVPWPQDKPPVVSQNPTLNPWRYTSSYPTNNTSTYDLWVDLVIRGKTNRVCNWSTQPIVL